MTEEAIPKPTGDPLWSVHVRGIDPGREAATAALLELGDGRIGMPRAPIVEHPAATPGIKAPGLFAGHGADAQLRPLPDCGRLEVEHREGAEVGPTLDLEAGLLHHRVRDNCRRLRAVIFGSLARPGTVVLRAEGDPDLLEPGPPLRVPRRTADAPQPEAPPVRVSSPAERGYVVDEDDGCACVVRAIGTPGGAAAAARQRCDGRVLERLAVFAVDTLSPWRLSAGSRQSRAGGKRRVR